MLTISNFILKIVLVQRMESQQALTNYIAKIASKIHNITSKYSSHNPIFNSSASFAKEYIQFSLTCLTLLSKIEPHFSGSVLCQFLQ